MSRYGEMCFGITVMIAAAGLFIIAGNVQEFIQSNNGVGAAFMPRVAASILLLLGFVTFTTAWRLAPIAIPEQRRQEGRKRNSGYLFALISILLMAGYVAFLDTLGFVIASAIYIFFQILILRKHAPQRWFTFMLVAILLPITAYLLFAYVFDVMVPTGLLE